MTPLEKALQEEGKVNYCDECEHFKIVGNTAYCKVNGKLIHPIMLTRGQGRGPAWNCKKRKKPLTNYDQLISKTPEELAYFMSGLSPSFMRFTVKAAWLNWLKQEVEE